jgi:hypothetical protein
MKHFGLWYLMTVLLALTVEGFAQHRSAAPLFADGYAWHFRVSYP